MFGQASEVIQIVQRGMASQQAGKLDAAEALYKQALAIDANQFEALHFLGVLQAQRGNLIEAERLVSRSLTLNAQRAEAHLNQARILRDLQRPEATIESCYTALRLNPKLVAASVLLGNALRDLACYDAALEAYERAIALRPGYHDVIHNRGILQLGKSQFEQGWAGLEHRFEISEQTVRRPALPGRIWAGEPLSSKSIVVHGEQGYGDIITDLALPVAAQQSWSAGHVLCRPGAPAPAPHTFASNRACGPRRRPHVRLSVRPDEPAAPALGRLGLCGRRSLSQR